jgi:hypothetical protein
MSVTIARPQQDAGPSAAQSHDVEVTILRWPQQEDLRRWLAQRRQPRILLVDTDAPAPDSLDDLEDWVRGDLAPTDQAARCRALRQRAIEAHAQLPFLDADGLLRHGDRWVAIPEGQLGITRLLLDRLHRVVPLAEITLAYEATGGSGHPNTMRTAIGRLAQRAREVQLELVTIRGRGVLLSTMPPARR